MASDAFSITFRSSPLLAPVAIVSADSSAKTVEDPPATVRVKSKILENDFDFMIFKNCVAKIYAHGSHCQYKVVGR